MNAFLIVCPHCQARYQLPNADANGKAVACKKCGQKFTAKVMRAAPKPEEPSAPTPAADDPFGDMFSSAGAADPLGASPLGASPLGALPRKKSSSKAFPWGMVAIGGGAVAMLAILVVAAVSVVGAIGSGGAGAFGGLGISNSSASQAYAQHSKIADEQYAVMMDFVKACESLQSKDQVPAFVEKIRSVNQRINGLADRVRNLPPLTDEQTDRLRESVDRRVKPVESRARTATENAGRFRTPEMVQVMLEFQAAGNAISAAIVEARERQAQQLAASQNSRSAGTPANVASQYPTQTPADGSAQPASPTSRQAGGSGGGSLKTPEAIRAAYINITDSQYVIQLEFLEASREYQASGDAAALVAKLESLTPRMRDLYDRIRRLPEIKFIDRDSFKIVHSRKPYYLLFPQIAVAKQLYESSSPEVVSAALDFRAADIDVYHGVESSKAGAGSVSKDLAKYREIKSEYVSIFEKKNEIVVSILGGDYDVDATVSDIRELASRFKPLQGRLRPMYGLTRELDDVLNEQLQPRYDAIKAKRAVADAKLKPGSKTVLPDAVQTAWKEFDKQHGAYNAITKGMEPRGAEDTGEDRWNHEPQDSGADFASRVGNSNFAASGGRNADPYADAIRQREEEIQQIREREEAFRNSGGMIEVDRDSGPAEEQARDERFSDAMRQREEAIRKYEEAKRNGGGMPSQSGGPPGRFGPPVRKGVREEHGVENTARFEFPAIERTQYREILNRLKDKVDTTNQSGQLTNNGGFLEVKFSGDIEQLAKQIDFAEVSEVLVEQRIIRLKSVSIPK